MRSKIMANDTSHRKEFKERTLKRVQDVLNHTAKIVKLKTVTEKFVLVKGLQPKQRKEE